MKFGDSTQLIIGTKNLEESYNFYNKLGFDIVIEDLNSSIPWKLISDWSIAILLKQDYTETFSLTYFSEMMDVNAFELEVKGIDFRNKNTDKGNFKNGEIISPDGFSISLIKYKDASEMFKPEGLKLHEIDPENIVKTELYTNPKIGMFGEFSHPVKDIKKSLAFWAKLGFETIVVHSKPYPWAIMTDEVNVIGLHQTEIFSYPTISYFAYDMNKRIRELKEEGIKVYDFAGRGYDCNNVVLITPENQRVFLLKADMKEEE